MPLSPGSHPVDRIRRQLTDLGGRQMLRLLKTLDSPQDSYVKLQGHPVLLLCSNNYLGLATHPALKEAAIAATERWGTGTGASRLVSGSMRLHAQLEEALAAFKGTESALLFNTGFTANTALLASLAREGDVIFSDALNHASIIDGCRLSKARTRVYPHNDMTALEPLLREESPDRKGRFLIVTDGVFSMDGDTAPLKELVELKKQYDAWLMVDDAHGTGVLGPQGKGTAAQMGVEKEVDLQMGTLGKGLGGFGAYVAAARPIVDFLINTARPFIFSTSLPPACLGSALAAVELVQSEEGEHRRECLRQNRAAFLAPLSAAGLDFGPSSTHIVPILTGEPAPTMKAAASLLDQGIFLQGIRPPTVPEGTCRLRATLMADHRPAELTGAAQTIVSVLGGLC